MTPVRSEELPALMDGELDAERAAQVQARIDADPALRAEYAALFRVDLVLRGAAEAAAFVPDVAVPLSQTRTSSGRLWAAGAATVIALLVVRFLSKFIDAAAVGLFVQLAAGAAMLLLTLRLTRTAGPFWTSSLQQEFAL